jgi:hypothetical protein
MNNNDVKTKQLKIKKSDWIRIDEFRLELARTKNVILTKIDTISLLLDQQLKNKDSGDEK